MIHNISRFIAALALLATAQGAWAQTPSGNWNDWVNDNNIDWNSAEAKAAAIPQSDDGSTVYISTAEQLAYYAYAVNNDKKTSGSASGYYCGRTVELMADIDLSAHYWTPIGINRNYYFNGFFHGNGHVISGMTINFEGSADDFNDSFGHSRIGFFGYIRGRNANTGTACITDLTLKDFSVRVVYYSDGTKYVGGLVGICNNNGTTTSITNCCLVNGTVSTIDNGKLCVGGLVGDGTPTTCNNNYRYNVTATKDFTNIGISGESVANCATLTVSSHGSVALGGNVGVITDGKIYAASGETVTLSGTPEAGYMVGYTASGVTITDGAFTMPDNDDASIAASFSIDPAHFSQSGDTYTIHTATGWGVFCDCLNDNDTYNRFSGKTVRLGDDITVTRMAGSSKHDFCGTFDGGGNTLTVTLSGSSDRMAPFSYISNVGSAPAAIRNLNVVADITSSGQNASALVGEAWGELTIEQCTVSGTVAVSKQFAGGIIGSASNTPLNISNCISSVTISSTTSGDGTHGGFAGRVPSSATLNISGCVFDGKIITTSGTTNCGGFVGHSEHAEGSNVSITNSLYAPTADDQTVSEGCETFCRNIADGHITNSYYTRALGTAQGKATRTVAAAADVTIEPIALTGTAIQYTVSGITAYSGGGLQRGETLYYGSGDQLSLTLSNSATGAPQGYRYDGYTASAGTLSGTTLTMPDQDVTISVNTAALAPIDWATVNQGNSEDPYMIYNKDQLLLLAHRVNDPNGETANTYQGKNFKLGADITFSHDADEGDDYAENYVPIGGVFDGYSYYFCGDFDGDGHTVSGIRIRKDGTGINYGNVGLFGYLDEGSNVHDVHLTDARITGYEDVGGIAGYTYGTVSGCSVTDSYITATGNWICGTICGENDGTLRNNYYHGCTVNGTAVTSGEGCLGADITANNGALPAYRLDLGANITTPPGTFAGQTEWLDTPPVNPRLAPENGFTLAGNHYFASGYEFTPGSTLASGAAQGYTPRATLGDVLLDLYTPTGDNDLLAGKAIARLTVTADCDGKTLASTQAIYSTRQSVTVAYIKADGTPGEASAIALDGHETVAKDGDIHLAAGTYYVGTDIAYANQIVSDGNITLILANGKTMTLNGNTTGIAIGYNLTIYGQSLDDATAGTLRYNGTWEGIHAYYYEQHSGNVSITTTGSGVFGINADVTLRGGTLTVTADGTDACAIYGYTLSILGGQLTATATGDNATGIYASANDGTAITLGWTRPADRITASSISTGGGTVAVADGKKLHNGSGYLSGYLSDPATALNGKTLRPAATATYTTADGTTATADAILLDASDNSLPAGNYLATGTLNYTHGITLAGDVTLILADNCHMNVGTSGEKINGHGIVSSYDSNTDTGYDLTIYGQAAGTGTLSVYTTGNYKRGITANTLTINGGNVTADTDGTGASALSVDKDVTINGGTVNASTAGTGYTAFAIYASKDFNYNGGNVTATVTNDDPDVDTYGIYADGNITLGWTNYTDCITASSYGAAATIAIADGTIAIADGKPFTDTDGNNYSGTLFNSTLYTVDPDDPFYDPEAALEALNAALADLNAALGGKTLYPYIETLDLAARQAPDENYWTTFYCGHTDYRIDDDENACAYTATYADGKLTLHNQGKQIPKSTAVIIVADNGVVSMTAATVLPAFSGTNDLRGVNVDTPVANITSDLGEGTLYVLGMTTVDNEQHFGFHRYTGTEMPARKAFLHVPGSSNARALDMVFANEETGIGSIESGELRMENFYTLDGRKLNGKPTKPGLYINNGRKVVIK